MADFEDPTAAFPASPEPQGDGWVLGGRYRVTGRIGSGGMADVFRAHDELLSRDVAVKVFRSVAATADTAAGIERQRAELHALARLNHPNLITLYDGSVAPDERAYLVMELVEGPNLGDRIEQGPPPTESEVRVIGAQVAEALAYVHQQGMVHRDIKPANILLGAGSGSEQVRARLSDFGIVRLLGAERLTQADSTLGTASYLAPEQARGSGVGPAADVYALGLTLVEALTGVRSFDGPTPIEAVIARLDRDPEIPANLPRPWPELLTAMTVRDPAARPSAAQVGQVLRGTADATTQFIPAGVVGGGAADAATTMIPAAAPMPPVRRPTYEPAAVVTPVDEPRRRANVGMIVGLVLAAVLALLGAALVIATSGGDGDGGGASTTPTPTLTTPSRTSSSAQQTEQSTPPEQTDEPTSDEPTPTDDPTSEEPTSEPPSSTSSRPSSTPPTTAPSTRQSSSSSASSSTPAAEQPIAPSTTPAAP